jgi:hypothetical protein
VSILEKIAAQRQKLLDGIDANEGDINLRIFEDFYPDEAHFIYELLQNAEDAGATEVEFELTAHGCFFEHNGSRHFNERDIRGITGIFNSSKKDSPDKIGKFGVGFKSVFVYTDTPIIYSKDYSFKILKLVLPQSIKPKADLGGKTRFEFPFNNPKKNVKAAFSEVKAGLEQLSETTLLFLNNLRYISWKIGEQEGAVLREEHSSAHVEVLKLSDGKEILSSHWLRFSAPVQNLDKFTAPMEGIERQKVTVAFALAFMGDSTSFDVKKPLAKQLKIVPAVRGKVAVFFTAEKETSGLRFHLHAPFIPELSRASIKSSPENLPLFEQLASVAASSLHEIKELGLLTGEFLATLPNNDDSLPERYALIRDAVLNEMRTESLVPTYGGGFAPAARLCQARASLKGLLSFEDLAYVTGRDDQPQWSISASQKNSNQDRFLASLGIQNWDADNLKTFFESNARKQKYAWDDCELDQSVIGWLSAKPDDWLQSLYALLNKHCEEQEDYGELSDVYFLRLASQEWSTGSLAYFQTGPFTLDDPLGRVDERILTAGTKKSQQQDARRFLEQLGVREPDESDELDLLLQSRYGENSTPPSDQEYLTDLKRIMVFLEKYPSQKSKFLPFRIFKVASLSCQWAKASNVYLDEPFASTDLKRLYALTVDPKHKRWPLDPWFLNCDVPIEKIVRFAEQLGCQKEFENLFFIVGCEKNVNWRYLSKAPGSRAGNVINKDFALTPEALLLLKSHQLESALLVWKALRRSESSRPTILKAHYQLTDSGGPHISKSQLVCQLEELPWVPQTDGSFVKPSVATASKMPKGFAVDTGYKWMEAVGFGIEDAKREVESTTRALQRKQLGFGSEDELQDAQAFAKLPKDERERLLANAKQVKSDPVELPERPVRNGNLRSERVGDQAKATPEKSSAIKPRSVQLGVEAAKLEAKLYLADQYTNTNGQMICQACKGELPFKLPNGSYYFEAVEIIRGATKRFREGFLALCPNHAAAYQHANAQCNSMYDVIATATGNEVELALGNVETSIYFTQMHLADAKACFESIKDGGT